MNKYKLYWHYNVVHPNISMRDRIFKEHEVDALNEVSAREKSSTELRITTITPIYLKKIEKID